MEKRSCFLAGKALSFVKYEVFSQQFRVQREELATCVREPIMAVRKLKQKNGETLWTLPYPSGEDTVNDPLFDGLPRSTLRSCCSLSTDAATAWTPSLISWAAT